MNAQRRRRLAVMMALVYAVQGSFWPLLAVHLADPRREFGRVRLWGTAGWMIAGWVVSLVMAASGSTRAGQGAFEALWIATALSAVVSIYCLTLPHTPPLAVGPRGEGAVRAGI